MFSLSTSWNASRHNNGYDLVNEIKGIGFDTIELSFALTGDIVNDILSLKEKGEIKISSLHNMCPLPEEVDPPKASPDYYSLSSLYEKERRLALKAAKNTIFYANRFNAKAVVLHAGRVQIKDRTRDLASLIDDKKAFDILKDQMVRDRESEKGGYLDSVIKSLEELVTYAKRMKVAIGIENRYYYREIPLIDELTIIFDHFRKGSLYYWHDVGHAEVFERLGLVRHKDLLDRFANRLIGIHLHDIIGVLNDHNPPGSGAFDFKRLAGYVKEDTIKVIEAHQPATAGQIAQSARSLKKIFG